MSITTHAELITAVGANWKHRADLASIAPDLIMLGEKWIMRKIRGTDMEAALSVAISASGIATAPTGFLGLKYAYIDGTPTKNLIVKSPQQILTRYPMRSSEGKPAWIGYDAGNFMFGPFPDSTYTVKGTYWKRQGPLASAVYDLFTNNPDLFLFAALAEAEAYVVNDKRVPLWISKRDQIAHDLGTESQGIGYSGGMSITVE